MPGFNPDNINIHDLTIEEPAKEKEAIFDLEEEITQENWEYLKRNLETLKTIGESLALLHRAESMKIVNPEIDICLDENDLHKMLTGFLKQTKSEYSDKSSQEYHDEIYWPGFINSMAAAKTIDPELNFPIDKEDWQKMDYWLEKFRQNTKGIDSVLNYGNFLALLIDMKRIKPETNLELDQETWAKILDTYEQLKNTNKEDVNRGHFFRLARSIKILNPEFDLKIKQEDWMHLRREFETLHKGITLKGIPAEFFSAIETIAILTAEKVEITEEGYKITSAKKFSETENSPLPEQRKF